MIYPFIQYQKNHVFLLFTSSEHVVIQISFLGWQDPRTGEAVDEELWVTRKGATPAEAGQLGIIPGSMGVGCTSLGIDTCRDRQIISWLLFIKGDLLKLVSSNSISYSAVYETSTNIVYLPGCLRDGLNRRAQLAQCFEI